MAAPPEDAHLVAPVPPSPGESAASRCVRLETNGIIRPLIRTEGSAGGVPVGGMPVGGAADGIAARRPGSMGTWSSVGRGGGDVGGFSLSHAGYIAVLYCAIR